MPSQETFILSIPLPIVALTAVLLGIAFKYLCCCDKDSQKARLQRIRKSRRSRGRYPGNDNPAQDVTIPAEFDNQTMKCSEASQQYTDQFIFDMPSDPPPPYHPGPPPSYSDEEPSFLPTEGGEEDTGSNHDDTTT